MQQQIDTWAARWRIPPEALRELAQLYPTDPTPAHTMAGSEAAVVAARRLRATQAGGRLWRNNVGAFKDERGNFIRFGLMNDSAQLNARIKSPDLIGIEPVLIGPEHVGTTIGRFVGEECKAVGWRYRGDAHERAQLAALQLINALGGRGEFVNVL